MQAQVALGVVGPGGAVAVDGGRGVITLGNLDARRDWGWAPDYVDCMIRAMRHPDPDDFVVATGVTHSVGDFARVALEHAGVDPLARGESLSVTDFARIAEGLAAQGPAVGARA